MKTLLAVNTALCAGLVILFSPIAQGQNLFDADATGSIYEFTPGGAQSTFASGMSYLRGIAFDSVGDLFVDDVVSGNIYKFTPSGTRTTIASGLISPWGLACNSAGDVFVASVDSGNIYEITPGGTPSIFASGVNPVGLAFNSAGDLFDADGSGHIYEFTPAGVQTTFASGLDGPDCLAFGSDGNLFVGADDDLAIYEFTPNGARSTFASGPRPFGPLALAVDNAGDVFMANGYWGLGDIDKFTPNGQGSIFAAGFPEGLAFQPVPEPSTWVMVGMGLGLFLSGLRSRRRSS
jgi:DNA-binding beta-propeller fold protein YncE